MGTLNILVRSASARAYRTHDLSTLLDQYSASAGDQRNRADIDNAGKKLGSSFGHLSQFCRGTPEHRSCIGFAVGDTRGQQPGSIHTDESDEVSSCINHGKAHRHLQLVCFNPCARENLFRSFYTECHSGSLLTCSMRSLSETKRFGALC